MKKSVEELDDMVADLHCQVEVETQRAARARAEKNEEHQRAQKLEEQMEELNTETVRLNRTLADLKQQQRDMIQKHQEDLQNLEDKTQVLQKGMQEYTGLNVKVS
jgi:hypothetical protein